MKNFSGWIGLTAVNLENGQSQDAYIFLNNEATDGFDALLDGKYERGNGPVFYSLSGQEQLTTNSIPAFSENIQVEFVFLPDMEGVYQIEAVGLDLVESQVFMYDNVSRLDHNFSLEPTYRFNAIPTEDSVRFTIHFQAAGIEKPVEEEYLRVFFNAGILNVSAGVPCDRIVLYGMNGMKVIDKIAEGSKSISLPLQIANGIYIIRCVSGNRTYSKKITIG